MAHLLSFLLLLSTFSDSVLAMDCKPVPTRFSDNRIYVNATLKGNRVSFYTDSGGGYLPFVYLSDLNRLGMKIEVKKDDKLLVGLSTLPAEIASQNIPLQEIWKKNVKVFAVPDLMESEIGFVKQVFGGEGFFGATFFAGHVWRFNYPKQELRYCNGTDDLNGFAMMPMFFKTSGKIRNTEQPRMEMEVAGEKFPMLFDTGATSLYSDEGLKIINKTGPVSSSFIRASVAARWEKAHPKWRVIRKGDRIGGGMDLIEVPEVSIAGIKVGPVWFAARKDKIYDEYSRDIMDSNIDGAVGGNVFRWFEIVADYPGAKLYFRKP